MDSYLDSNPHLLVSLQMIFFKVLLNMGVSLSMHGGLSQWGRSNRPRIRPGTVKSLNAPWELSKLALWQDYAKKIDPSRMLVWLGRRTVQNMVKNLTSIGSGQYTLAGRYKLGRSCSNSNLLRPRVNADKLIKGTVDMIFKWFHIQYTILPFKSMSLFFLNKTQP